jgi:hypothetical protein
MLKYKVSNRSEELAQSYADENGGSVSSFNEKEVIASDFIPDVSPRQIRQALLISGASLSQIDTALNSLPEPTKSMALVEWEYSVTFQRNRPLVNAVGQLLGWTSTQLDNLWKFAATL